MKASKAVITSVVMGLLAFGVLVVFPGSSHSDPPAPPAAPDAEAPVDPAFDDLVRLVKSGADAKVLLAYIDAARTPYHLTADQLAYLADLGVAPEVLQKLGAPVPAEDAAMAETPEAPAPEPMPPPPSVEPAPPPAPDNGPGEPDMEGPPPAEVAPPPSAVNISFFYQSLSPYGTWVNVDGAWYWQPTAIVVDSGWRPYCQRGRWVYTDCGWAWYSDYSWGWAPFHYGRWRRHDRYGWIWAPDTVWGPAWVCWRQSTGAIGWAPLPPEARYVAGVGFSFHNRRVGVDFDFGLVGPQYTFVQPQHFCDRGLARRVMPPVQVTQVFVHTTVIQNNYTYVNKRIINHGPPAAQIAQVTQREIRPVTIVDQDIHPGQAIHGNVINKDRFAVYRPRVAPTAPETPRAVIERQRAETAKRVEAQAKSAFTTYRPGAAVQNESARGQSSRQAVQPVVAPTGRPRPAAVSPPVTAPHPKAVIQPPPQPSARPQPVHPVETRQPLRPVTTLPQPAERPAARLKAQADAAARLQQEEAAARQRAQQETVARQRQQEEAASRQRAQQDAATARAKMQAETAARQQAQAETAQRQQQQDQAARLKQQEAAARQQQQQEAARLRTQQEAAARQKEDQQRTQQAEAARQKAQADSTARLRAQEDAAARVRAQEAATASQRVQPPDTSRQPPNAFQDSGNGSAAKSASQRGTVSRKGGR